MIIQNTKDILFLEKLDIYSLNAIYTERVLGYEAFEITKTALSAIYRLFKYITKKLSQLFLYMSHLIEDIININKRYDTRINKYSEKISKRLTAIPRQKYIAIEKIFLNSTTNDFPKNTFLTHIQTFTEILNELTTLSFKNIKIFATNIDKKTDKEDDSEFSEFNWLNESLIKKNSSLGIKIVYKKNGEYSISREDIFKTEPKKISELGYTSIQDVFLIQRKFSKIAPTLDTCKHNIRELKNIQKILLDKISELKFMKSDILSVIQSNVKYFGKQLNVYQELFKLNIKICKTLQIRRLRLISILESALTQSSPSVKE